MRVKREQPRVISKEGHELTVNPMLLSQFFVGTELHALACGGSAINSLQLSEVEIISHILLPTGRLFIFS